MTACTDVEDLLELLGESLRLYEVALAERRLDALEEIAAVAQPGLLFANSAVLGNA